MLKRVVLKLVAATLYLGVSAFAQSPVQVKVIGTAKQPIPGTLVPLLPSEIRDQGAAVIAEPDPKLRLKLADTLGKVEPDRSRAFLIALLADEPSAQVRAGIIDRLVRTPTREALEVIAKSATHDPDVEVSIFALDRYRYAVMKQARDLLEERQAMAHKDGNSQAIGLLAKEQERWVSLLRGTMLPSFLQQPPPVFEVKPVDRNIRVLAFGDYGNGSENQREVAAAIQRYNGKHKFDFGITLGDNFYNKGMAGPADPRWKTQWEQLYSPLGIQFYATLGNHDWGFADSPAAEVLYTSAGPSWRMPATYYTFTAGPVQFFALDTNEVPEAQLIWLKGEIAKSQAQWKIVYGHHPIYSAGAHSDNAKLIEDLLPLLKDRVDIYLAGHDHDMQHLKPENKVHFFVAGGAGAGLRKPKPGPRSLFAQGVHGFSVLEASDKELTVRFLNTALEEIYSYTLVR